MKVVPVRLSRSNETERRRHIWKKVLYWILEMPGWCKYLQYIKVRPSLKSCFFPEPKLFEDLDAVL